MLYKGSIVEKQCGISTTYFFFIYLGPSAAPNGDATKQSPYDISMAQHNQHGEIVNPSGSSDPQLMPPDINTRLADVGGIFISIGGESYLSKASCQGINDTLTGSFARVRLPPMYINIPPTSARRVGK